MIKKVRFKIDLRGVISSSTLPLGIADEKHEHGGEVSYLRLPSCGALISPMGLFRLFSFTKPSQLSELSAPANAGVLSMEFDS
jgi:hypothetical protein